MKLKSGSICGNDLKNDLKRGGWAILLFLFAGLLISCNKDNKEATPTGTASGKLVVPPENRVEVEPNDAAAQAQPVPETASVSGAAAASDPGFTAQDDAAHSIDISDLYHLSAAGPVRVILSIASDKLDENDLDLFLLDPSGKILDFSQGLVSTEFIETTAGGEFLIGVRAFQGSSAYLIDFSSLGTLSVAGSDPLPPGAEWVPDELIVKRKEDAGARRKPDAFAARNGLMLKQSFPGGADLMALSPEAQPSQKATIPSKEKVPSLKGEANALKARMWETIQTLRRDPQVAYAEPHFIRRPSVVPNDERYPLQWHYSLISLPQAWEVSTGSDDVIVAVIDSGVLFDHPDLGPRLMDGFDFIQNPASAGDLSGIDADATDVGDDPKRQSSSFHGTHVAGTIGAATNNATGVSGITWQTRIMPLRVCGSLGCSDADIAQAILYAAGLENSSGTLPPQPAKVINMSLGGAGRSETQQEAITRARNAGVIVVAAAGNENTGGFTSPAGLEGVISVAAVDINSRKASYSNYGPTVDVAAPGGNGATDLNGDGFPDGILSAWGDDSGRFGFRFMQGTSMAAPHVSGVLALMLAVNPKLVPADIDLLLAGTHPETPIRITRDLGRSGRDDLYGQGLIDASQAVLAAKAVPGGTGGTAPAGPILAVSNLSLDFSNFMNTLQIDLANAGIGTLTVTSVAADAPWLTATPASGTAPLTVNVTVDRTGLPEGTYSAAVQIASDAAQNPAAVIQVKMRVGGATSGNVGTVFVLVVDKETLETVQEAEATGDQDYAFTVPEIPAGTYLVAAGTDRDDDGVICDQEDACGFYADLITITEGEDRPDVVFTVGELVSPQRASSKVGNLTGKKFKRRYKRSD